jgi:nucleotide-binding universal stress UspA family protein
MSKERPFMKIVATVDFSITSESLLKHTKEYAKKLDAEVFLFHAEPDKNGIHPDEVDNTPEAVRLKKDAKALEHAGVKVTPVFVRGPVCENILKEAIGMRADLIILGAHGHGGLSCKASVGHISECVLLKSKIPVLIIPS